MQKSISIIFLLFAIKTFADVGCGKERVSFQQVNPSKTVIVLYNSGGVLKGAAKDGGVNGYPIHSVKWDKSNGKINYKILQTTMFKEDKWVEQNFHFTGTIIKEVISGSYTSDNPIYGKLPLNASQFHIDQKEACTTLIAPAESYEQKLRDYIKCKNQSDILPKEPIKLIGAWNHHSSDGEHEYGLEVIFLKIENKLLGTIEDFSGLVGDGGSVSKLEELTSNKDETSFKFSYLGTKSSAEIKKNTAKQILTLKIGEVIETLTKVKSDQAPSIFVKKISSLEC